MVAECVNKVNKALTLKKCIGNSAIFKVTA